MEYPKIIKSDGFTLEKIAPTFENARKVFEVVDAERDSLRQFLSWIDETRCPEDLFMHIYKVSKTDNGSYYIKYDGKIVGNVGVDISSKKNKIAEIAYWLSGKYTGSGIMTRCVKKLEEFAFKNMDVNRIEIIMETENIKSEGIAKRAGYVCEGIRRS